MEINIDNFHPIGRDATPYKSGALIEAVTLQEIDLSELIGRYNLLLERRAAAQPQPAPQASGGTTALHDMIEFPVEAFHAGMQDAARAELAALENAVSDARQIIILTRLTSADQTLVGMCCGWLDAHPEAEPQP